MKKTYLVVGLGRFGSAVAQRLYELGSEVMAVDLHPELVQKMESKVTCAAVCDARDEDSRRGVQAVGRIAEMIRELDLKPGEMKLIVNRAPNGELNPGVMEESCRARSPRWASPA